MNRNLPPAAALLLAALLPSLSAVALDASRRQAVESALSPDVPVLVCATDDVVTGGQPRDAAWPKLARLGFRTVLNLRTPQEVDMGRQKAAVEAAGLKWVNIPVGNPTDAQLDQFLAMVRDKRNMPMLAHCAVGFRVGLFWMVHRILDDGFPVDKAREEAGRMGMRSSEGERWALQAVAMRRGKAKS